LVASDSLRGVSRGSNGNAATFGNCYATAAHAADRDATRVAVLPQPETVAESQPLSQAGAALQAGAQPPRLPPKRPIKRSPNADALPALPISTASEPTTADKNKRLFIPNSR
jgi:hypothetical protein